MLLCVCTKLSHFAAPQARAHAVASGIDYGGVTTTGGKIDTLRNGDSGSFCYHPRLMTKRNRFCSCNSETNQNDPVKYTIIKQSYIYILYFTQEEGMVKPFMKARAMTRTEKDTQRLPRVSSPPNPQPHFSHIFK